MNHYKIGRACDMNGAIKLVTSKLNNVFSVFVYECLPAMRILTRTDIRPQTSSSFIDHNIKTTGIERPFSSVTMLFVLVQHSIIL